MSTIAKRLHILFTIIALSLLTPRAFAAPAPPTPGDSEASAAALPPWFLPPSPVRPQEGGPWVVRAYYTDRRMVDEIAGWLALWEVHHDAGYLVAEVTHSQYERLLRAGFRIQVDARLTAMLHRPNTPLPGQLSGIPGYPCYRTVEETLAAIHSLAAAYPHLATITDIGDSWEKVTPGGNPGYDLIVLTLTNKDLALPKPRVLIASALHAREYATAELNLRFAEHLVGGYGSDPDVTWLLDYHELHLLFQANPDGRKLAETGLLWRKNTDNDDGCTKRQLWGTDLNRNFPFYWNCCAGSSGDPCAETYRGPAPASEPETQAIKTYLQAHFSDLRGDTLEASAPLTTSGIFLDLHSYGGLVLWPWGFIYTLPPNSTALQTLGRKLAYFNGYEPKQAVNLYPTDGAAQDFAYGELGLASYIIELGTAFFQDCATFENAILPAHLQALLYAAKAARFPYLIPSGPDVLALSLSPQVAPPGTTVLLKATVDDTRYNHSLGAEPTQHIAAAEYYVDLPPWITTTVSTSHMMTATDGAFDEQVEQVEAWLDTGGLSPGRHIIFVRGQDASGNWGAFSAGFLYLPATVIVPSIHGYVRQIGSGIPLSARITAGAFQTTSDATTGYYSLTLPGGTYDLSAVAAGHLISTVTGLTISATQTVRQDFSLYPLCEVLSDTVEIDGGIWDAQPPWAVVTENAHSPAYAWSDSPAGNYDNNADFSLTSPVLDLSGYSGIRLAFWHTYDFEPGHDRGGVEYSTDGGASWTPVAFYSGYGHTAWSYEEIPLPALDGNPHARVRFRVQSDDHVTADGWHIDDISIVGGGLPCALPKAAFSSNSPVPLGETMVFTNHTRGVEPLSYRWSFGDGDTSDARHPTHTYRASGRFTVTLVATNTLGGDRTQHIVTVNRQLYLPLVLSNWLSQGMPHPRLRQLPAYDKISPWVLRATQGGGRTDFLVLLSEQADLSPAYKIPNKQARGRWVYRTLWETASRTQAPLRAWLDARGVSYRPFYIVNLILVRSGDLPLAAALAARPDVARIEANPRVRNILPRPTQTGGPPMHSPATIEWNIQRVQAPAVWEMGYTGQGVVVGGQDTGYEWNHPALINQYRGWNGSAAEHNYNWYDAVAASAVPIDPHGHGTHTMGTILGDDRAGNQIGMAPGARWIGCRNMDSNGYGSPATYLTCFEFFLAPYPLNGTPEQGNPDLAPDVTNNSWSCPTYEGCSWDTLQAAVEAQRAAGILTVAAAGNAFGAGCGSITEPPALYDAAYTVGATTSSDTIASFSRRGPVTIDGSGRLKPDLSAPGVSIRSAVPGGGYQSMQGTSMAAPHVAGAVALLWSAQPALRNQIDRTEAILNETALPRYSTQCGDPPASVPNNVYGWGRLDVLAAVRRALEPGSGYIAGTVVTVDGSSMAVPLEGVVVSAESGEAFYTTTTDHTGYYTITVVPSTYTLRAWKYGFAPETVTGLIVPRGGGLTVPLTLTAAPVISLTGCVTDALTAQPLSATISLIGPTGRVLTHTTTRLPDGCYALRIYGGPYTVTAAARLHYPATTFTDLVSDTVVNFALEATTTDGIMWGRITELGSGRPVSGVLISLSPGGFEARSQATGFYELQAPYGHYTATLSSPFHRPVVDGVVIPQSNLVERNYALPLLLPPLSIAKTPSTWQAEAGTLLTYTIFVTNFGHLGITVTVEDRLPEDTLFAWAGGEGVITGEVGEEHIRWAGLSLPAGGVLTRSFGVTLTCVPSGTPVVNVAYRVVDAEWPTPTVGLPVTVTVTGKGVSADFAF
ncbi:MAG: M14 family zinc carboxypeptidase, partial [Anaerolineae bacterium]|nr:M14 family zinc carboxypeptidase [Anaerolineae bacterium]